jgi:hypothetical protein
VAFRALSPLPFVEQNGNSASFGHLLIDPSLDLDGMLLAHPGLLIIGQGGPVASNVSLSSASMCGATFRSGARRCTWSLARCGTLKRTADAPRRLLVRRPATVDLARRSSPGQVQLGQSLPTSASLADASDHLLVLERRPIAAICAPPDSASRGYSRRTTRGGAWRTPLAG